MRALVFFLSAAAISVSAKAADNDALIACARIAEPAERLACYDRQVSAISADARKLVAERQAAEKAAAEKAAAAAAVATAEQKQAAFGRESMPVGDRPAPAVEQLQNLESTIDEVMTAADGKLVLVLANGQMWRQSDTTLLPPIKPGMEVEIKRGAIGGYRITIPRARRTISAKRMR